MATTTSGSDHSTSLTGLRRFQDCWSEIRDENIGRTPSPIFRLLSPYFAGRPMHSKSPLIKSRFWFSFDLFSNSRVRQFFCWETENKLTYAILCNYVVNADDIRAKVDSSMWDFVHSASRTYSKQEWSEASRYLSFLLTKLRLHIKVK